MLAIRLPSLEDATGVDRRAVQPVPQQQVEARNPEVECRLAPRVLRLLELVKLGLDRRPQV